MSRNLIDRDAKFIAEIEKIRFFPDHVKILAVSEKLIIHSICSSPRQTRARTKYSRENFIILCNSKKYSKSNAKY